MKYFLLIIIRLYWLLIPKEKRRKCIFNKSCSIHVYEETKAKGFQKGLTELVFRMRNCNSFFDIFIDLQTGKKKMLLKNGTTVDESQIAEYLK